MVKFIISIFIMVKVVRELVVNRFCCCIIKGVVDCFVGVKNWVRVDIVKVIINRIVKFKGKVKYWCFFVC